MADAASEKWALLIAVEWYSDELNDKRNLGGVHDVEHTATFLKTSLGILSDHITLCWKEMEANEPIFWCCSCLKEAIENYLHRGYL